MLTRVKWKLKLKKLMEVRRDATSKLKKLKTPRLPTPPHLTALVCIHNLEGGWPSNTGNGYYGGLQMNLGFQRTYAEKLHIRMHYPNLLITKGTADNWTPKEQLWVAEMAILSRGFYPWPNTARYCGLI